MPDRLATDAKGVEMTTMCITRAGRAAVAAVLIAAGLAAVGNTASAARRPDLVVSAVTAPARVVQGSTVTVRSTVRNNGTARARRNAVRVWLSTDRSVGASDRTLATTRSLRIRAGKQATIVFSVRIPAAQAPGRYYVLSCADVNDVVVESREGNNCAASSRVVVDAANRAPVAADDGPDGFADQLPGTVASVPTATLLANDTDADGDTLTITAVSSTEGDAVIDGDQVLFTPGPGSAVSAHFTYTVSDGTATDTAVVTIPVNNAPVAVDDDLTATTVIAGVAHEIPAATLLGNDEDADGDTLVLTAVGDASNAQVVLSGGTVFVTSNIGFTGIVTFSYTVSDGQMSDTGSVSISADGTGCRPLARGVVTGC